MKIVAITVILGMCFLGGCAQQYTEPEIVFENETEQDEYAVYSLSIEYVYLRNLLSHNKNPIESIIIIAETNDLGEYWIKKFIEDLDDKNVPRGALEDWRIVNRSTRPLLRKFKFSYEYQLVARDELDKYDADTFFTKFYEKYPDSNGLISVSSIGFDKAMNTALIHVIHSYGSLGANYYFIFLEKKNGTWGIVKRISTRLS